MALWALVGLLSPTGLRAGQESDTPVFRATSSQVVFEFIAVDRKGSLVPDLRKEELEVSLDGRTQRLDFLIGPDEKNGVGYVTPAQVVQAGSPEGSTTGPGESSTRGPALGPSRLWTAILLDLRVLDASNFSRSVAAIRRFIDQSLYGDGEVMLAVIDRGLKIVTPFTRDRALLLEGAGSLRPAGIYSSLDRSQSDRGPASFGFNSRFETQIEHAREGLSLLCRVLSGVPGSRHIIFFSEGYPLYPGRTEKGSSVLSMVRDVVSLANMYGVKFYTVDARGLPAAVGVGPAHVTGDYAAGPGESAAARVANSGSSETGLTELLVANLQQTQFSDLENARNVLLALAGGTNGSAFVNSNDLGVVLRASTAEDRLTYWGSFQPSLKGKPKFRKLHVKCRRKGVIIRSQAGFTDFSPDQALSLQLAAAMERPEFFNALHPFMEVRTETAGTEVVMGLPGPEARARPAADQFHLSLGFVGKVFDENGEPVTSGGFDIQRGFSLDLTQEQFGGLAKQPLKARASLNLPHGKHRLVLVVVDQVSGALGAIAGDFFVP